MSTKANTCLATLATMILLVVGCGSRQVDAVDTGLADTASADSAADAVAQDMGLDAAIGDVGSADMNLSFPAVLEGVWLIGWSGGMNHFSWVRFSKMATPSMTKKDAFVLDGKTIGSNLPLWECSGKASYWMGAAASTIYLDIPAASCASGVATSKGYSFGDFDTSGAGAPKDVILSATVQVQATLQKLSGYKYPDTWCDAAMTSCKAPF
jgi:hypothetical protein